MFQPAVRQNLKLRMAICGPSKAGKSYTGLRFAFGVAGPTGRVAAIDTEFGSLSKYHGLAPDGIPWRFDVCPLTHFAPTNYTQAIQNAGQCGYDVLIVDSLSHAWVGTGGALAQVDARGGNKFTAWKDVTPQHDALINAILSSPCHIIATMRSKMDYVLEEEINARGQKKMVPRKVGMAPVQRQGVEYEFDIVADMDNEHLLKIDGARCPAVDGARVSKPDATFIKPIMKWLNEGASAPAALPVAAQPAPVRPTASRGVRLSGSTYSQHTDQRCSPDQVAQIQGLATELQIPVDDYRAALARRGVEKTDQLSVELANEFLAALAAKKTALEAAEVF